MPLTATAIKNIKPSSATRKLSDGGGLYLEVSPKGGKWWRLKFRFGGKEKRISLGTYPTIPLKTARERRDEARKLLTNGIDPSEHRQAKRAATEEHRANSFEVVAREWFSKCKPNWVESHAIRIIRRLERDIFPWIGKTPIADLTPSKLLTVLRKIEDRDALETAHRAMSNCGQIIRYAVASERAKRDITQDLRGALQSVKTQHFASITEPKKVAGLLRAIDGFQGTMIVKSAMRLAPLTFVRPGELRHAEWVDMDLNKAEWGFLVTKTDTRHIVPLSRQAVAILREIHSLTGRGRYVFPSARSSLRPMSDNAVLAAMRTMGIPKEQMTGHGFRAMARTIIDEVLNVRPDFIEHQLAHAVRDPLGRSYNRTSHLVERKKMMQQWADYLDTLKEEAEVVYPLQRV